ncbi:hypothetical protein BGZ61DRAFT_483756 [Ilyonectria robusta]|uniref:uncharacterized protein n=1 Tax=Ilyonectria robusta TaxID=1079257 RepID=UPI001E8DEAE7|nr:uncharacterized protein BGZ61DRAFT_483756 [Ilyonectria robusta]KAH8667841.1 hypothetical protein BGZ61DRAFT_483756 [Ilyonectria robusta]
MGGLSTTRRKEPPRMLDLSIGNVERGQDTPTSRPTTSTPIISTPTPTQSSASTPTQSPPATPIQSPPGTPAKTIVETATRLITTKVEAPTATVFITVVPNPQTVTVNGPQQITAQPDNTNESEGQSSVPQPVQGITFTSNTGVALLGGLGGLAAVSILGMAFIIVWRKRRRRALAGDGVSKMG